MAQAEGKMAKMKGGKIREMRVVPASNKGFISHTEHEPPKGGQPWGPPSPPAIHPTFAHLVKHMKATLGAGAGPAMNDEGEEAGEAPGS